MPNHRSLSKDLLRGQKGQILYYFSIFIIIIIYFFSFLVAVVVVVCLFLKRKITFPTVFAVLCSILGSCGIFERVVGHKTCILLPLLSSLTFASSYLAKRVLPYVVRTAVAIQS